MEDVKAVNYMQLIPILTGAIQKQEQKINNQDKKIADLTKLVGQLVSLLAPSTMWENVVTLKPVNKTTKK